MASSSTASASPLINDNDGEEEQRRRRHDDDDNNNCSTTVSESTIRKMTRVAGEFGAINLGQGFPNEAPPLRVRQALAYTVLYGHEPPPAVAAGRGLDALLSSEEQRHSLLLRTTQDETTEEEQRKEKQQQQDDITNQYCPPMGRADVRQAVCDHYERLYQFDTVTADQVTITLGATEAVATALRTVGRPGDKVVVVEPFHELYPNQCEIFYLQPTYVTLRQQEEGKGNRGNGKGGGDWTYDPVEFRLALSQAKILLLNTPHNPTGKVFTVSELKQIVEWCCEFNVYIITDEIYEHMVYDDDDDDDDDDVPSEQHRRQHRHVILPLEFPNVADRVFMCNSIGKSASATGWRLGWCIHPIQYADRYRAIHDQLVVMSPHPMQVAALTYLNLPTEYFSTQVRYRYKARLDLLLTTLRKVGFRVTAPAGSYFLFAQYLSVPKLQHLNPMQAAMYMIQTVGVACIPGDVFYGKNVKDGSQYLRFAACRSTADVEAACKLMEERLM